MNDSESEIKYQKVFEEIVKRTAKLVSDWQCVGFVHGVLNTDNMSIVGLTIDYGPYGFLDRYDPYHIFNGSGKEWVFLLAKVIVSRLFRRVFTVFPYRSSHI